VVFRSPYQREVVVSCRDPTGGNVVFEPDLLSLPARIRTSGGRSTREYFKDRDTPPKYVRNAAGEPFDRGPERIEDELIFTIRKFVSAATYASILNALHTNNNSPKTIKGYVFDSNTLLLATAEFDDVVGSTTGIQEAALQVEYKPGGWVDVTPNVGYTETLPVGGGGVERNRIKERDPDTGELVDVTKPYPLFANGIKKPSPTDDPDDLFFYPYTLHAWTGVPLA
jgi:hypothetical protein